MTQPMIDIDFAKSADLADLSIIEQACFSRPWSEQSLAKLLENENAMVIIARGGGRCVGYIGAHIIFDECEIMNIGVLPAFRRQGVAFALLSRLLSEAALRNVLVATLEVRASNSKAISLYSKFGYKKLGVRKNYYTAPVEDAIILRADILSLTENK